MAKVMPPGMLDNGQGVLPIKDAYSNTVEIALQLEQAPVMKGKADLEAVEGRAECQWLQPTQHSVHYT